MSELTVTEGGLYVVPGEFNLFAKYPALVDEWIDRRLDSRCKKIARHLAVELFDLDCPAVLTDIFRPEAPRSVHHYGRGIDLRITCSMKLAEVIREKFNRWFPYGKGNMQTIPELDHGSAPQFHIQQKAR